MRIGRTVPPAAAPIGFGEIVHGLSGILRGQAEVERFRKELKDVYGVRHAYLVSSGKAALALILQALKDLKPDQDEVLVPAYTCYSVPSAIVRAGLKARLCDIDPETLDFDFQALPKAIQASGRHLLAVVPVHLYGLLADIDRLKTLVDPNNVFVIEDAAQAMGGFDSATKPGTLGDAALFSLGRGKSLSSVQGGVILSNQKDIAQGLDARINRLPGCNPARLASMLLQALGLTLFLRPSWFWIPKSIPWLRLGETIFDTRFPLLRMSPFQAGLLRRWKNKLHELNSARRDRARRWQAALWSLDHHSLRPVSPDKIHESSLIRLPVKARSPRLAWRIAAESEKHGLGIMPAYPASLNRVPFLQGPVSGASFPGAEQTVKTLLTFPIHPLVTQKHIQKAVGALRRAVATNEHP